MRKKERYEVLRTAITLHSLHGILVLYNHLPRYYFSADDVDKINARWQVAYVDGGRASHAEAAHLYTLRIDDDDAGCTLVVVRCDGHLTSCGVGLDVHREWFSIDIVQFGYIQKDVCIVAIGDQFA